MKRIRGRDTKPELIVRKILRQLGFSGYRLHRTELPGKPDIVFIGRRKAILVHGCFWHGHSCKIGIRKPLSNTDYWLPKIARTQLRDTRNSEQLKALGWKVLVLWECELKDVGTLSNQLTIFMSDQ